MTGPERFSFDFAASYRRASRPFGVTPDNSWLEVDNERLAAHFGRWRVRTPLANITGTEVTGPYSFWKTAGPARLGITDRGLTFATNGRRGLRIDFREKVRGIDPKGFISHPELTVTVTEIDRLDELLRKHIAARPKT